MEFYISFVIIAIVSILLIVIAAKRIFGKNYSEKIVLFPSKIHSALGSVFLLFAIGVMMLKAVYAREEGVDGVLVGCWVVFALGLLHIYLGFRHKIFIGSEIVVKLLLCHAKQIEWSDIDVAKIRHDRTIISKTSGIDIIKIYSHGKKVFSVNENYSNYNSFLIALTERNIKTDDYKDKKKK